MSRTVVISETTYTGLQSSLDTYTDAGYKVVGYQIIQPAVLLNVLTSREELTEAVHCVIMIL